jgi:hypothetical protein
MSPSGFSICEQKHFRQSLMLIATAGVAQRYAGGLKLSMRQRRIQNAGERKEIKSNYLEVDLVGDRRTSNLELFFLIQFDGETALLDFSENSSRQYCCGLAAFARGSFSAIQVSWVWIAAGEGCGTGWYISL